MSEYLKGKIRISHQQSNHKVAAQQLKGKTKKKRGKPLIETIWKKIKVAYSCVLRIHASSGVEQLVFLDLLTSTLI